MELEAAIEAARREHRTDDEYRLRCELAESEQPAPQRVEACIRAGVQAERMGMPEAAAEWAQKALEVATRAGDEPGRVNALSELGVQARIRGDLRQSEEYLTQGRELAIQLDVKALIARCRANLAITLRTAGLPDRAFDESAAAARLYRDMGNLPGANRMLHLQAQIQQDQGLLEQACTTLEEVIALDELTGDTAGSARSMGNLGLLLWRMGENAKAAARLQKAMEQFAAAGSRLDVLRARGNIGLVRRAMGDVAEALALFEQCAAEATELGLPVEHAHAQTNRAGTLVMLERFDEAESCLDSVASEDYRVNTIDLTYRARIAMHRGKNDDALEHARHAAELARGADNPRALADALRLQAELLHAAGDLDAARESILEALEHLDHADPATSTDHLICTVVAAGIEQARGGTEAARNLAAGAIELAAQLKDSGNPDVRQALNRLSALNI